MFLAGLRRQIDSDRWGGQAPIPEQELSEQKSEMVIETCQNLPLTTGVNMKTFRNRYEKKFLLNVVVICGKKIFLCVEIVPLNEDKREIKFIWGGLQYTRRDEQGLRAVWRPCFHHWPC